MKNNYNINELVTEDGFIYCKIKLGVYGFKKSARLAYDNLIRNLKQEGYYPDNHCPNIWSHESRDTKFCLCVDDFSVKYSIKIDADHIITTLKKFYDITIDWSRKYFCGLDIEYNYDEQYIDISMKHFVIKILQRLQHTYLTKPQYAPYQWTAPNYGNNKQFANHLIYHYYSMYLA